jgi:hypothetical protein
MLGFEINFLKINVELQEMLFAYVHQMTIF